MSMAALLIAVCLTLAPAGVDQTDTPLLAQAKVKKVRVNFEGAKLVKVVKWVTRITGKNFIVEDSLRERKITILSGSPVTIDEAYQAFLDALEAEGLRVETAGKFLKITRGRRHRLHSPRADISLGDCPDRHHQDRRLQLQDRAGGPRGLVRKSRLHDAPGAHHSLCGGR
jgi:type II secretory pathway component GspD/PulD (secretin)